MQIRKQLRLKSSSSVARANSDGKGTLVLGRRESESILIGDDIEVILMRLKSSKARVEVSAPEHIDINRSELLESRQITSNNYV